MFKELSEVIGESAGGWVLAGAAAILLAPAISNILRGAVVGTTRGILSLAEGGAALSSNVKQGWNDLVNEAKTQKGTGDVDPNTLVGAGAGGALGASLGTGMGPVGAAVGGGLGSVVGASVGGSVKTAETKDDKEATEHKK